MYKWALFVCAGAAAFAQSYETWVATYGTDSNPCTLVSPCRTFYAAQSQTKSGGTIRVLNAGEYGGGNTAEGFTITKSLTLDGGGLAVIEVDNGSAALGITVASGNVRVRNLILHVVGNSNAINGFLTYGGGILAFAPVLTLENITVAADIQAAAITISGDAGSQINLRNVSVVGGYYGIGISLNSGQSSPLFITMEGVSAKGAFTAGLTLGACSGAIRDSAFNANAAGIQYINGGINSSLLLDRTEVSFNTTDGFASDSGSTTRLSNSTITGNTTGINTNGGGTVISFRNNVIAGNGTDNAPALATSLR